MICSECPRALTARQVAVGNVTCSRACGHARLRRLGPRLEAYRQREAALRTALHQSLEAHALGGLVPLGDAVAIAVAAALDADTAGYLRGYDKRLHREQRARAKPDATVTGAWNGHELVIGRNEEVAS